MGEMRNRKRLETLQEWTLKQICSVRQLKTPVPCGNDYDVKWTEPKCFLGNYPLWASTPQQEYRIAPSILILCGGGFAAADTSEYLDSRNGINRPDEIGGTLDVQLIHALYEPGERTGIKREDGEINPKEAILRDERYDEGTLSLIDWMEDTMKALIGAQSIPNTDLIVKPDTVGFELLKDNGAIADRRPFYLGFVKVTFSTYSAQKDNDTIDDLLS